MVPLQMQRLNLYYCSRISITDKNKDFDLFLYSIQIGNYKQQSFLDIKNENRIVSVEK